jgi:ComF family protein
MPHLSSVPICDAYWIEIQGQSGPCCARCGDSLDAPASFASTSETKIPSPLLCRSCRLAPPPFVRAVAYGPYEDRMRSAIHALKYGRVHGAARALGRLLAESIAQLSADAPSELLVIPVPLHRSRYAQRGFNQARSLVKSALEALRKTHPVWQLTLASSTLMRHRSTESQSGLTPRQRRQNVRGAFSVSNPSAVAGRHVLVVDDIFTTGATVRAASRALLDAGAATVWVATLARARRIHQDRRGSFATLQDQESESAKPGFPPADVSQFESMRSSPNQPSF